MSPTPSHPGHRSRRQLVLLLACLLLAAGGCAHMSKPTIGIGGTDESARQVGR